MVQPSITSRWFSEDVSVEEKTKDVLKLLDNIDTSKLAFPWSVDVKRRDVSEMYQLGFGDPASEAKLELESFHNGIMLVFNFVLGLVGWGMLRGMTGKRFEKGLVHGAALEFAWTVAPAVVLVGIAVPSLRLLYWIDEILSPAYTIKVVGHQWYWSYEYSDLAGESVSFDSYMIPTSDLNEGDWRLLEVDRPAWLPVGGYGRAVVTAADVIHCWTVPALGVKGDAIPGRLNQLRIGVGRPGWFYGQCSEICGSEHSFMPIVVRGSSAGGFAEWLLAEQDA